MRTLNLIGLGLLGLLLYPLTAHTAQTWQKSCQAGTAFAVTSVAPGGFVCNDSVANTNSAMLDVSACREFEVLFSQDLSQAGASTSTVNVYACTSPTDASGDNPTVAATWSAADTCFILENITLDGIVATNTEAIYGAAGTWIYSNTVIYGAADTPRTIVRCNP